MAPLGATAHPEDASQGLQAAAARAEKGKIQDKLYAGREVKYWFLKKLITTQAHLKGIYNLYSQSFAWLLKFEILIQSGCEKRISFLKEFLSMKL